MNKYLRTFFAMELSLPLKDKIIDIQKHLQINFSDNKLHWIAKNSLHITLQFIGPTQIDDVANIVNNVRQKITDIDPFNLSFSTLNLFPNNKRPSVIALQLIENENLIELVNSIRTGISLSGYAVENRIFRPHLSIARFHSRCTLQSSFPQNVVLPDFYVDRCVFFSSELSVQGTQYTKLTEIFL